MPFHFFIIFGSLYRGGQSGRKEDTKIFNLHSLGACAKSPHLCLYMLACVQTDNSLNSQVPTASII